MINTKLKIPNHKQITSPKLQISNRRVLNFGFGICLEFVFCFLFFVIFAPFEARAATLYFSPSSGNFSVGDILTVGVIVNTQGQPINNADSVISFSTDLLEVVSVNKSGSIFSLWVEEPAFSNSAGVVSFNGGLPTPGFNGTAGRALNVVFRAKNSGTATVLFSSGAVRANDGYGTDVLQSKIQAQFSLISEERPVQREPAIVAGTPQAPNISSPTHPNSDEWYSEKTAMFKWSVPSGVTATRLLVGRIVVAQPAVSYIPPIEEKIIPDLEDGVWYFHAQLRNNAGWGGTRHFRFQIDTTKPDRFELRRVPSENTTDPRVRFTLDATDKTSGIDHSEIQIDNKNLDPWRDDGTHIYQTPILEPGEHILIAKAVDKAGNFLLNSTEFTISSIEPPVFTEYPQELQSGEIIVAKGSTYPGSEVIVWIQKDKDDARRRATRSNTEGVFTFVDDERTQIGVYNVWAEVVDSRGAKSNPSDKITIVVKQLAILRIGSFAISFLSILVPLIGIIVLLVLLGFITQRKYLEHKRRLRKEIYEAEDALHKAFDLLRKEVKEQITLLEHARSRRNLTDEEHKIINRLKRELDSAEKIVSKEVADIRKEIE